MMKSVAGTEGYPENSQRFIEATLAIDFMDLHKDFLPFIPHAPGRVLDAGAGIGRDAAVLSGMGHSVVAVEPTEAFRAAGKELYHAEHLEWLDDALPDLKQLKDQPGKFDFILVSGVWHHLDQEEQKRGLSRLADLLAPEGIPAMTLRSGPAGAGTHVFSTDTKQTILNAEASGLSTLLSLENLPSLMRNKEEVKWAKLVFRKSALSERKS